MLLSIALVLFISGGSYWLGLIWGYKEGHDAAEYESKVKGRLAAMAPVYLTEAQLKAIINLSEPRGPGGVHKTLGDP